MAILKKISLQMEILPWYPSEHEDIPAALSVLSFLREKRIKWRSTTRDYKLW